MFSNLKLSKLDLIFGVSIVVVLLLFSFLILRNSNRSPEVSSSSDQSNPSKRADPKKGDDYLRNQVRNVIIKKTQDVKECYREFLKSNPKANPYEGAVSIDWEVSPKGEALHPEVVSSEITQGELGKCLIDKVKDWRFPSPPTDRNTYVVHKFIFKKE